jgi:hypothetical protein
MMTSAGMSTASGGDDGRPEDIARCVRDWRMLW